MELKNSFKVQTPKNEQSLSISNVSDEALLYYLKNLIIKNLKHSVATIEIETQKFIHGSNASK
jgi:hypothetical protein